MNISNKYPVMIFKNEDDKGRVKYAAGISRKEQDGSYVNASFQIQFNKGVELPNQTKILIKNAWLSFYNWEFEGKKGTTFYIKCSDFELASEESGNKEVTPQDFNNKSTKKESNPYEEFGNSIEISDDDLPF